MIYVAVGFLVSVFLWTRWAVRWGATDAECDAPSTGALWFQGLPGRHLRMTRAVSIASPPDVVWKWFAQLGRGAGWASYDCIDNVGRRSARHLVRWIPDPALGDASAIGRLRHVEPEREIIWWSDEVRLPAARLWLAWAYRIESRAAGSRVLLHIDMRTAGPLSLPLHLAMQPLDSIMAIRQLRGLRKKIEQFGDRIDDPENPETGARDQYQRHHAVFAAGGEAGKRGVGMARRAWERARADLGPNTPSDAPPAVSPPRE